MRIPILQVAATLIILPLLSAADAQVVIRSGPTTTLAGILQVSSTPPGALVFVCERYSTTCGMRYYLEGKTPVTIRGLPPGYVGLRVLRDGYDDFIGTTYVSPQDAHTIQYGFKNTATIMLTPRTYSPGTGAVLLTSSLPAHVFVDGTVRGTTPMTVAGLTAGIHKLEMRRPEVVQPAYGERIEYATDISITAGITKSVYVNIGTSYTPAGGYIGEVTKIQLIAIAVLISLIAGCLLYVHMKRGG